MSMSTETFPVEQSRLHKISSRVADASLVVALACVGLLFDTSGLEGESAEQAKVVAVVAGKGLLASLGSFFAGTALASATRRGQI